MTRLRFFQSDHGDAFPEAGSFAEQARALLRYAILAPSGHNTQPWLFRIGEDAIDVFADRRRGLAVVDPQDRELVISCGAAIGTLEIAARHFAMQPEVHLLPDAENPDHLARVDLAPGGTRGAGKTSSFARSPSGAPRGPLSCPSAHPRR